MMEAIADTDELPVITVPSKSVVNDIQVAIYLYIISLVGEYHSFSENPSRAVPHPFFKLLCGKTPRYVLSVELNYIF